MAATIITTVAGATSNSYVTLAEAETYFAERLNVSNWDDAASDDIKNRALISAARRLDQEGWAGLKYDADQALAWPRTGTYDRDGVLYASDAIPEPVTTAQLNLALAMLGGDLLADSGLEGFINLKVGPIDVTPRLGAAAGGLPADVAREIAHLLDTPAAANFRIARG
jgi:hypothetical protein